MNNTVSNNKIFSFRIAYDSFLVMKMLLPYFTLWNLLLLLIMPSQAICAKEISALSELSLSTTPQLISFWGYPVETHRVTTRDGYILTLHRIPHGKTKNEGVNPSRPVFYLQHPLLGSSADWVLNLPSQSLAFMLADQGFDVWMGNVRGNTYSRTHISLSPNQKEFWDFSLEEHAKYDFPAMINYILIETGQNQLNYVGFSQGTLIAFAELSENIELQSKIRLYFALAPVTRARHLSWVWETLIESKDMIYQYHMLFGVYELLPSNGYFRQLSIFCKWLPKVCTSITTAFGKHFGRENKNLNNTRMSLYFSNFPAGTSIKNFMHMLQLGSSGRFQKYDYGGRGNRLRYGSLIPPEYDITKVDVPTVIISGSIDGISSQQDVEWTKEQLPLVIEHIKIQGYNHVDMILATSTGTRVNKRILDITKAFM